MRSSTLKKYLSVCICAGSLLLPGLFSRCGGGVTGVVVCGLLFGVAFLVAGQGHQGSRAPVIATCGR